MELQSGNIKEKLALIKDHWHPHIIGSLNEQEVKLAKLKGEFVWHKHDNEDEMFLILSGHLFIAFEKEIKEYHELDYVIIPKGVMHKPYCESEVAVMLFEPKTTLNTGDQEGSLTKNKLPRI